jgi:hypothetical protein
MSSTVKEGANDAPSVPMMTMIAAEPLVHPPGGQRAEDRADREAGGDDALVQAVEAPELADEGQYAGDHAEVVAEQDAT